MLHKRHQSTTLPLQVGMGEHRNAEVVPMKVFVAWSWNIHELLIDELYKISP